MYTLETLFIDLKNKLFTPNKQVVQTFHLYVMHIINIGANFVAAWSWKGSTTEYSENELLFVQIYHCLTFSHQCTTFLFVILLYDVPLLYFLLEVHWAINIKFLN